MARLGTKVTSQVVDRKIMSSARHIRVTMKRGSCCSTPRIQSIPPPELLEMSEFIGPLDVLTEGFLVGRTTKITLRQDRTTPDSPLLHKLYNAVVGPKSWERDTSVPSCDGGSNIFTISIRCGMIAFPPISK